MTMTAEDTHVFPSGGIQAPPRRRALRPWVLLLLLLWLLLRRRDAPAATMQG